MFIDFADIDELLLKFSAKSPDGLTDIFEGLRIVFQDREFRQLCTETLSSLGKFMGDERIYPEIRALLVNLEKRYDRNTLGNLIERLWDEGPIIGPEVEKLSIDGYGSNGKMAWALQELLQHPVILNHLFETMYSFKKEGFGFDRIDDALKRMVTSDSFCFDRKGDGEFKNGIFYEPHENFSFRNVSALKGLISLLSRSNVPLTVSSPIFFACTKYST